MMKKIISLFVLAIISATLALLISRTGIIKMADNEISDAFIRYFAPTTAASDDIVLVLLDESTMQGLPYRSPVPRDFLAKLNDRLRSYSPKVIAYDIFFKDPSFAEADKELVASLERANVITVSAGRVGDVGLTEDPPLSIFAKSVKGFGLSDLPFGSSDSTVRSAQFEFSSEHGKLTTFVSKLFSAISGDNAEELIQNSEIDLRLFGISFKPYKKIGNGQLITSIRFAAPPVKIGDERATFKMFPAKLVSEGLLPAEWFKDKVVMVGAAYDDGTDAFITPYFSARYKFERMPGVVIHANILNQLITKQFFYFFPFWLLVAKVAGFSIVACSLFMWGSHIRGAASLFALTALLFLGSAYYFNRHAIFPTITPFLLSALISYLLSQILRSVTEGRQKRFIKSVFQKYVPAAVVEKMVSNPRLLVLGGERKEVTSLFTDIASFTSISERLSPETLVEFLNDYLDRLTRVIFKHGGTLDKYEGDAIIAFFGAPLAIADHRESAIRAAIEMQKESAGISNKWKEIAGREITTRIGINSGEVVVGNMGSELRFDYTAIGDAINLASRLEGANKFFDTRILASESTIGKLQPSAREAFVIRKAASLKVKGKNEAVVVFEVAGLKDDFSCFEIDRIMAKPSPNELIELTSK